MKNYESIHDLDFYDFMRLYIERNVVGSEGWKYFKEDADIKTKIESNLVQLIFHLFKLKYRQGSSRYDKHWAEEIGHYRDVINDLLYVKKKRDKSTYNYLTDGIDSIYLKGIGEYKRERKNYTNPTLPDLRKVLPEESPWTFDELMEEEIPYLLEQLPNISK